MRVTEQQTINQRKTWTESLTISHYSNQSVELGQYTDQFYFLHYFLFD